MFSEITFWLPISPTPDPAHHTRTSPIPRTWYWIFCHHWLTPSFDLVWYYFDNSESYISICYCYSLDLEQAHASTPFERLYIVPWTLLDLLLDIFRTRLVLDPYLRWLRGYPETAYWIKYPKLPPWITIFRCKSTTVIVLSERIGSISPEPPVPCLNPIVWTPSKVSRDFWISR